MDDRVRVALRSAGHLLLAHHHNDLAAEVVGVESKGFLAVAAKVEVGIELHLVVSKVMVEDMVPMITTNGGGADRHGNSRGKSLRLPSSALRSLSSALRSSSSALRSPCSELRLPYSALRHKFMVRNILRDRHAPR